MTGCKIFSFLPFKVYNLSLQWTLQGLYTLQASSGHPVFSTSALTSHVEVGGHWYLNTSVIFNRYTYSINFKIIRRFIHKLSYTNLGIHAGLSALYGQWTSPSSTWAVTDDNQEEGIQEQIQIQHKFPIITQTHITHTHGKERENKKKMWGHDNLSSFTIKYLRLSNHLQEIKRRSVPFFPRCLDYIDLSCYTISEEESHLGTTFRHLTPPPFPPLMMEIAYRWSMDCAWADIQNSQVPHSQGFPKGGVWQGVLGGQGRCLTALPLLEWQFLWRRWEVATTSSMSSACLGEPPPVWQVGAAWSISR